MFNHLSYLTDEQIADFHRFIANNKQNIELITSRLMLAMGFKLSLIGSTYLRETIIFCYRNYLFSNVNFSKQVYPYLAQSHCSDERNVDRDLRTALKKCHENGRMLIVNDIFSYEIVSPHYPPSVNEFVVQLIHCINELETECSAAL